MSPLENFDLKFDNRSILEWYVDAKRKGNLDRDGLRRSMIARMLWKVSYQSSTGIIKNVTHFMGNSVWGENPRNTLAQDIHILRRVLLSKQVHLAFTRKSPFSGFYLRGRPLIDPEMERVMLATMNEVDIEQIQVFKKLTSAQKISQMASMIDLLEEIGVERLLAKQPYLTRKDAFHQVRINQWKRKEEAMIV